MRSIDTGLQELYGKCLLDVSAVKQTFANNAKTEDISRESKICKTSEHLESQKTSIRCNSKNEGEMPIHIHASVWWMICVTSAIKDLIKSHK